MKQIATTIVIAIAASLAVVHFFGAGLGTTRQPVSVVAATESVFEKIMRTRVLRCGYAVATPWFMVDAETNEFSGVGYDFTNAVAEKLGLEVKWMEETGWGIAEQGLKTGRYDMMCGSVCVDPRRTQAAYYSKPFIYIPVYAFARAEDARFDQDTSLINRPEVRIGVKNGHVFEFIASEVFPQATKVYLSDISDDTEFMLMVESNKADISFSGQETLDLYNKSNAKAVKAVGDPVRFCSGGFMLPRGEDEFKHAIDATISELNASGVIDRIVGNYMPLDERYIRLPAKEYRSPGQ